MICELSCPLVRSISIVLRRHLVIAIQCVASVPNTTS
jgi:hypothetical protein